MGLFEKKKEKRIFDGDGFDQEGWNRDGYDRDGYNVAGNDCHGIHKSNYENQSQSKDESTLSEKLENENFAVKQFDFAGGLERVIEVTYDKEKTIDVRLFFSSDKEEWSTFVRNFTEKVKDNFIRLKIEPSRKTYSRLISGGNYDFNDDFDAGYTLHVSMKYGDNKLMHQITSILRANDFGCLPSTKFTVDAHRNYEHPTEFEAEKILASITDNIYQNCKIKSMATNEKNELIKNVSQDKSQIDSLDKKTTESRVTLDNDPLKILKIRLAKGEITMDEFKELKDIL